MKGFRPLATAIVFGLQPLASLHAETSAAAREAIPFASLSETNRILVRSVTDHYTLRRPAAKQTFAGQKARFEWMLDHLHPTLQLARRLDLPARRTQLDSHGRLWTMERDGSKGFLLPVFGADGKRVFYMEGSQRTFSCTLHGRGVIVLNYHASATNTLTISGIQFVKVPNLFFAMLTQLFGPFLSGVMDRTWHEFTQPLIALSELAEKSPNKIREAAEKLSPEERATLKPFLLLFSQRQEPR